MTIIFKQNDRLPSLSVTAITSDGNPYDLTGATVVFTMRNVDTSVVKVNRSAAVLVDGPNGKVRYDWGSADLDTVGSYDAEFEATLSGRKLTVPSNNWISIKVIDDLA